MSSNTQTTSTSLIETLNNAIKNTAFTGGKAPIWYYDEKATGIIHINKAMADKLELDGVNLPKYKSGTPRTRFNYSTTPELYTALEALLTSEEYAVYHLVLTTDTDTDTDTD